MGAGAVKTWPQDSKDETGRDWRTDIGLDTLQVDVELAADVVNEGHPQQAQQNHHACCHAAKIHELTLGGLRTELLVKIKGDERGSRVEHRTHRAHDCRKQRGHYQANEADRQQVENESGVCEIGLFHLFRKQRKRNDTGKDEHEHRQNLQEASKYRSSLRMTLIARREHTLHNHLVRTPVPDAKDRRAEKDACPREVRIRGRLYHVEIVRRDHGAEMLQATNPSQTNDGEGDRAGDEDQSLHGVRVNDCGQAARDGVNASSNDQNNGRFPQLPAGDSLEHDARGIELHRNFREDVSDDGNCRQIDCALPVEAAFQELGHGKYVAAQVEGNEHPAENQQDQARQPFEVADRQSGRGSGAGRSYEGFRGEIRDEQRAANEEPSNVAACQEVILGTAIIPSKVHANAKDDGKVDTDNHEIDGCERSMGYRDRRCKQHPCLLGAAAAKPAPAYRLNETPTTLANRARPSPIRTLFPSLASQTPEESA